MNEREHRDPVLVGRGSCRANSCRPRGSPGTDSPYLSERLGRSLALPGRTLER